MYPPIFKICVADSDVKAVLGTNPCRLWPFGQAPQNETRPYAYHQLVYGSPENHLNCRPEVDHVGVQVDAYAKSASEARAVADAIVHAIETQAYIVSWNGEQREPDTQLYRVTFTAEFWTGR